MWHGRGNSGGSWPPAFPRSSCTTPAYSVHSEPKYKCTLRKLVCKFWASQRYITRWSVQCICIYIKLHRFQHFFARQSIRYRNEASARMKGPYGTGKICTCLTSLTIHLSKVSSRTRALSSVSCTGLW